MIIKPWIVPSAILFLDDIIDLESVICEFGSGASTLWFASHAKDVYTIDEDESWTNIVKQLDLQNIHAYCQPRPYADFIRTLNLQFDLIFIDGRDRVLCMKAALDYIKSYQWIVVDNSDRDEYNEGLNLLKEHSISTAQFWGGFNTYSPMGERMGKNWQTSFFQIGA